jgi:HAMP domain-containing protein
MKILLNHFSIRSKLGVFLVIGAIFFAVIVYGLVIPLAEKEKHVAREGKLLAVVESATSLMRYYEDCIRTYRWKMDSSLPRTREDAKNRIIAHLKQVRYGEDEHIFILDGSAQMVMHPLKTDLDGKDMSKTKAHNGTYPFQQMAFQSQRLGTVFLRYSWLSKWSMSVYEPQTTCAQYFYPWNWVVCSSLYTQDINDAVQKVRLYTIGYICLGSLIGLGVLYFIGFYITKPIVQLARQVKEVTNFAEGNTEKTISVQSNDEIGDLANAFRHTFETLRESHKRFLKVLDSIDATVYVADMDTYKILFTNRKMQESFGRDMTGEICYEVFRAQTEPCSHCTNDRLVDKNGNPADLCVWQGKTPSLKNGTSIMIGP